MRLTSGEAYFVIAQDAARPFVVEAQGVLIRDIGTEFEVKATDAGVRVTVAEGIVDVTEPARVANLVTGARVHRLNAGEQLSLTPTALAVETLSTPAPARPAAWREGFLVYENATLAEVVADANRYSTTPIRIMDSELGALRVTTAYRTDQISQMLSIVGATMPIDVVRTERDVRLVAKP
jgi:transmembrane sensor